MSKRSALVIFVAALLSSCSAFALGPCASQSDKLACVIPQEYGDTAFAFGKILRPVGTHPEHYNVDFGNDNSGSLIERLRPLTRAIGRQANLLPLASPSSGVLLTFDPSLKTQVISADSLGPVLGERAETVGRHRLFVGFSYQFFNFDKIDDVNLRNFPVVLGHTDDNQDNSFPGSTVNCSAGLSATNNVNGCAFVRDVIKTNNSIDLKVNQYTTYVTFGSYFPRRRFACDPIRKCSHGSDFAGHDILWHQRELSS